MIQYHIYVTKGPSLTRNTLVEAKTDVERYVPLKRGWKAVWVEEGQTAWRYVVRNSKGALVNSVRVVKINNR